MVTPKKTETEDAASATTLITEDGLRKLEKDLLNAQKDAERLANELSDKDQDLEELRRRKAADDVAHLGQVKRLEDLAETLQRQVNSSYGRTLPLNDPANCLTVIIGQMQPVAVGGDAHTLRQTVHDVARHLSRESKQTLREFITRLRGAAEAVEQESATLLL